MACPPLAERHADVEEVVARRRELVVMPAPDSSVRESPGAPSRISLKFPQPRYRLRMISGVQRSAKIGPRAIGQYWPYVLTTPVMRTRRWL